LPINLSIGIKFESIEKFNNDLSDILASSLSIKELLIFDEELMNISK